MTAAQSGSCSPDGSGSTSPAPPQSCTNDTLRAILNGPPRPLNEWKFERATNFKQLEERQVGSPREAALSSHISAQLFYSSTLFHEYAATPFRDPNTVADNNDNEGEKKINAEHRGSCSSDLSFTMPFLPKVENGTVYTIPTSRQGPEYFAGAPQDGVKTLCIIMVGLPARGKTFLAQKICRLLGWHGCRAKVLNVQVAWRRLVIEHRRHHTCAEQTAEIVSAAAQGKLDTGVVSYCPGDTGYVSAEEFRSLVSDPNSLERDYYRRVLKLYADYAREFFQNGGEVLVLNDDFPTEDLRDEVESLFAPLCSQAFFMEVIRDSKINQQFNTFKVSDASEYPSDVDPKCAADDFARRVEYLKSVYTTLTPVSCHQANAKNDSTGENGSSNPIGNASKPSSKQNRFIKVLDGAKIEVHGVTGYTASRIVSYVMNLSQLKIQHPIYFTRHGESEYNLEDRIGGDPPLTAKGEADARELLGFLASLRDSFSKSHVVGDDGNTLTGGGTVAAHRSKVEIWTSQLRRAIQTVGDCETLLGLKVLQWSSLNEIHAGICENYTYTEVREKFPLIDQFRRLNKYSFRYPEGESYQDLVMRLEPVIMELENADHVVVVVAHQAILRALLAYFGSTSAESCVRLEVPHRTVWRCTYNSKGIASLDELQFERQ